MTFQDKPIQCFDCGVTFTFTPEEQASFQSKGFTNSPKWCPTCRQSRKERQASTGQRDHIPGYQSQRQTFTATYSRCGNSTQVLFQPREGRAVYCRDCYSSVRVSR